MKLRHQVLLMLCHSEIRKAVSSWYTIWSANKLFSSFLELLVVHYFD